MRPSRRPVRTFEEILHLLPSTQLTMLGSFYPSEKLRVIDQLHLVAQRNAAFRVVEHTHKGGSVALQDPSSLCTVNLSSRLMGPYLTIHPYYANDLERAKELFAPSKEFDPEFDEDCQVHAITLSFLRAQPPYPNYDHLNGTGHPPPPHLAVDVFDDTTWTGTFDSPRLPPDFLNPNDLIVTTCHLNLRANPDHGEAAFYLVVTEIRIVHVARDFLPA
ncbi:hypothetical protein NUW54_g1491 [Trametes sanguinea]|uniref:Uncharacterized protein n=1 Tax=Trametes sanguinea TaxID=158606 RepID=A0ACC1Q841_9APHY|nr:hypothetical protein NUW54_g1491 [Trametes sanguinea]